MGMPVIVDVRDEDVGEEPIDEVVAWLHWVDRTFSTYKDDSEICRIDRGELAPRRTPTPTFGRCSPAARSCPARRAATSTSAPALTVRSTRPGS